MWALAVTVARTLVGYLAKNLSSPWERLTKRTNGGTYRIPSLHRPEFLIQVAAENLKEKDHQISFFLHQAHKGPSTLAPQNSSTPTLRELQTEATTFVFKCTHWLHFAISIQRMVNEQPLQCSFAPTAPRQAQVTQCSTSDLYPRLLLFSV